MTQSNNFENAIQTMERETLEREAAVLRQISCNEFRAAVQGKESDGQAGKTLSTNCFHAGNQSCLNYPDCQGW